MGELLERNKMGIPSLDTVGAWGLARESTSGGAFFIMTSTVFFSYLDWFYYPVLSYLILFQFGGIYLKPTICRLNAQSLF